MINLAVSPVTATGTALICTVTRRWSMDGPE